MSRLITVGVTALSVACSAGDVEVGGGQQTDGGDGTPALPIDGLPELDGPCRLDAQDPTRLLLTTTDFSTGALTVVDLATETVERDVALGSSDAIPFFHDGLAYIVHRFQLDYVDVLDSEAGWISLGEHPINRSDLASTNPQCASVGPEGLVYVTLFETPQVRILDASLPPAQSSVADLDIGGFADPDGNPEANHCFVCGSTLWVNVRRLDSDYAPVDHEQLVAFDLASRRPYDADPSREGLQGIELEGEFVKQVRRDPADPDGHTILALTTGIVRIDLRTGTTRWAVPEDTFAAAGLAQRHLPQSFDVTDDGGMAILAAYDDDFAQTQLYTVTLDDGGVAALESFAEGFDSVERTIEIVGDRLWYGSTRSGAPGLWIFDLAVDPPTPVSNEPLSTGLPPYSLIGIP